MPIVIRQACPERSRRAHDERQSRLPGLFETNSKNNSVASAAATAENCRVPAIRFIIS